MPSSTVEDYLKCIYNRELETGEGLVSTGSIAGGLGVAPGTVTSMVKGLSQSGLVSYAPYSGVELTPAGRELAARVLRRHRVVELFLVEILGMDWSEVHRDAEVLEHAVSDRILARMDKMLDSPRFDPHGDPIPSPSGELVDEKHPDLLTCPLQTPLRLARVLDQHAEFLKRLESHGLTIGSELQVIARDDGLQTVTVRSAQNERCDLGYGAAAKVLVEPTG